MAERTTAASTITWVGHSTVHIQMGESQILTDPLLRRRIVHLRRRSPPPADEWLRRVDAVLISHLHHDHCDLPTLRRLRNDIPIFVPVGAGTWMRRRGFHSVEELAVDATCRIGSVSVTAVPAHHSGQRPPFGPTAETIGFVVSGSHHVYFAGDTDLFPEMVDIHAGLDCALLPVWGWGRSLGHGHMNPQRAAEALALLRPRIAIPIHWGTYHPIGTAMLDHRFLVEPPQDFKSAAAMLTPDVDVRVIPPGGHVTLR